MTVDLVRMFKKRFLQVLLVAVVVFSVAVTYRHYRGVGELIGLRKATSRSPPLNVDVNIVPAHVKQHSFLKGSLKTAGRELTIFVHYAQDYITDSILSLHSWEPHLVVQVEAFIKAHPGIQVLDIGCNLGVYTLTSAALGCSVVAVDANPNNTARLVQSLLTNGLEGRATVLLNAISNERKTFQVDLVPENIGGSHIKEANGSISGVKAIFIDDLVPLFDGNHEVLIKMDIETKEIDALKRASRFFSQRNVILVLMEWEYIKRMEGVMSVLDFFAGRGYRPFRDSMKTRELMISDYLSWPVDVFWLR